MKKRLLIGIIAAVIVCAAVVLILVLRKPSDPGHKPDDTTGTGDPPDEPYELVIPADSRFLFAGGVPSGIVWDGDTLLVTDTFHKVIWRVDNEGAKPVTGKVSGEPLTYEPEGGYLDGPFADARFTEPWAIAPFLDGFAVTDTELHCVRYMDSKEVYTLVGSGDEETLDGVSIDSKLGLPTGLAAGPDGELYIADTEYGTIRRLSREGRLITVLEGLYGPTGLCYKDGVLYIAETGKHRICAYENGELTVLAGKSSEDPEADDGDMVYADGYRNGKASEALFSSPQGIAVGNDGTVYIADTDNSAIRVLKNGYVSTLAESDGTVNMPIEPRGIVISGKGKLYITDLDGRNLLILETETTPFDDVKAGASYEDAVNEARIMGIAHPEKENSFSPEKNLTRAEAVKMLAALNRYRNSYEILSGNTVFTDVMEDADYAGYAAWAVENEYLSAQNDKSKFAPDADIAEKDVILMIASYGLKQGADTEGVKAWMAEAEDNGSTCTRARAAELFVSFVHAVDW